MNSSHKPLPPLLKGLLLAAILILAFFMAYIPHLDYRYPLHVDEWWRYGDAQSLIESGSINYPDPFDSGATVTSDIEVGFHILLGELKLITGISWLDIFRFLPGVIFALLAFAAYAFSKRRGFGLAAAFLVALIPTTIRFLGPAFLVPVAMGLIFIPLTLFVLHRFAFDFRGTAILSLMFISLMFIHPPTLVAVSLIFVIHLVFFSPWQAKSKRSLLQLALPFCVLALLYVFMRFWAPSAFEFIVKEAANPQAHLALPPIQDALPKFGTIPLLLFILGAGIMAYERKGQSLALVISALALLAFEQIYPRFYIGPDILYERGWLYTFVLMALLGGVALSQVWRWAGNLKRIKPTYCYVLIAIISLSALAVSVTGHLSEPYYHVVD